MLNNVQESTIKPAAAKKSYNSAYLKTIIEERTKDWWSGEDATDENKQQKNRFIWTILL
jgi:hypothetical protein